MATVGCAHLPRYGSRQRAALQHAMSIAQTQRSTGEFICELCALQVRKDNQGEPPTLARFMRPPITRPPNIICSPQASSRVVVPEIKLARFSCCFSPLEAHAICRACDPSLINDLSLSPNGNTRLPGAHAMQEPFVEGALQE